VTTASERPAVLVTGAATGIGATCVRRFARLGYDIALNFRTRADDAKASADACRAAGAEVLLVQGDVADNATCRRMVDKMLGRFGRLDVLVNNAGTTRVVDRRDLDGLSTADFERILAVNLIGAFQMVRASAKALGAAAEGAVVNVSSHSGFSGYGSSLAYAASKGALNTLTLGLARSLAPSVRVNAVCPGFVDTDWVRRSMDETRFARFREGLRDHAPLRRLVSPEDVADAVAWLATGARSITGQLLVIDAGMHLNVTEPLAADEQPLEGEGR
jgi:3-oxoacyl-[acyl-carrier protein] reductase